MTTKTCTKCGVEKPLDRFYKQKFGRFGRMAYCKECVAARRRAYRAANREKIAAQSRAYYEANREKDNARSRAYHEANREKQNAQRRARDALIGNPTVEKWQEISLKHATRNGEPWREQEDRYLATSTARAIDDALALQRSYRSVRSRRFRLIAAGLIEKQSA